MLFRAQSASTSSASSTCEFLQCVCALIVVRFVHLNMCAYTTGALLYTQSACAQSTRVRDIQTNTDDRGDHSNYFHYI